MFQFIYWLKAIAAVFITNSHYADIWPVSAMAAGGHLGNCLFFLVSGFCLYRPEESFPKWYLKRIMRIYPALWVAIGINLILGHFHISSFSGFVWCFFYPTWYHFIASIMILYVLYYAVRKLQSRFGVSTSTVIAVTLAACVIVYLFFFDKSWYHIDDVEENWVRFQFWVSMILGAHLREAYEKIQGKVTAGEWICLAGLFVGYFAAKVLVSRVQTLSAVQFLSPMVLVLLVYRIAVVSAKLEKRGVFTSAGKWNRSVEFVASVTLEIYLVQNVIIGRFCNLVFPLNFFVVTALILGAAWAVHLAAVWVQKVCSPLFTNKGT